jgi:peptidyl-prolyl cis-trans isomerase C
MSFLQMPVPPARRLLLTSAAALMLVLPAAAQTPAPSAPGAAAPAVTTPGAAAPTAPAAQDDPVVARVNDKVLRRSDVVAAQKQLPAQVQQMPLDTIYPLLLDQMVNSLLIADAGRAIHLDQDADVKHRLARIEDRLIQEAYLAKQVEGELNDEKLRTRYQQFVKDNPPKEEVSARHILLEKEEQAKAVIAELDKGADFVKLAKEKSTGPSSDTGGDLGFFSREDMVPEFSEVAFSLQKGEYTKTPVKTQFGWHIIRVEDRRTAAPPSFEDAREELTSQISRDVINDKVKDLRQKAKVETFSLDGGALPPKN